MIEKFKLKEGAYYVGTCRNTNIAKWFNGKFIFINLFFDKPYVETISYFGDVKELNRDGFIPIHEIEVNLNEIYDEKNNADYKNYARRMHLNSKSNLDGECWKPIHNYVGLYDISNYGRIRKCNGNMIMKQNFSRDYLVIGLSDESGIRKTHRVHRLVAKTFKYNDNTQLEVNHINGIKTDNRGINLEWVTHSENSKRTYVSGNKIKKLTPEMVVEIKRMLNDDCSQIKIAEKFNIGRSTISEINTNKKWVNIKI